MHNISTNEQAITQTQTGISALLKVAFCTVIMGWSALTASDCVGGCANYWEKKLGKKYDESKEYKGCLAHNCSKDITTIKTDGYNAKKIGPVAKE